MWVNFSYRNKVSRINHAWKYTVFFHQLVEGEKFRKQTRVSRRNDGFYVKRKPIWNWTSHALAWRKVNSNLISALVKLTPLQVFLSSRTPLTLKGITLPYSYLIQKFPSSEVKWTVHNFQESCLKKGRRGSRNFILKHSIRNPLSSGFIQTLRKNEPKNIFMNIRSQPKANGWPKLDSIYWKSKIFKSLDVSLTDFTRF